MDWKAESAPLEQLEQLQRPGPAERPRAQVRVHFDPEELRRAQEMRRRFADRAKHRQPSLSELDPQLIRQWPVVASHDPR